MTLWNSTNFVYAGRSNIVRFPITNGGTWTVVCEAGTSALTNVIIVADGASDDHGDCSNGSIQLGSWRFNSSAHFLNSESGEQPMASNNVSNVDTVWGHGLQIDSTNAAGVSYAYIGTNGVENMRCVNGAVCFYFRPDWNSGAGPGHAGRLLEMGDTNSADGWWSLGVDPHGTNLVFQSKSNGVLTTYFHCPVTDWSSNQWHELILSYSSQETGLAIDGNWAAHGRGMTNYPNFQARWNYGFSVGCDHSGQNQACGVFDELRTYTCFLPVDRLAPAFLRQPEDQVLCLSNRIILDVVADGDPRPSYQWTRNGSLLAGATNASFQKVGGFEDSGTYAVIVSNLFGQATSAPAVVTVTTTPIITTTPTNLLIMLGQTAALGFSANPAPSECLWLHDGIAILPFGEGRRQITLSRMHHWRTVAITM